MNYTRIYTELIERAKERKSVDGYKEIHHIIPRSEGGTDESDNLVELTAREHFIAHKLLWMENPTFSRSAAFMLMSNHRGITWGSLYEIVRKQFSESEEHPLRNPKVRKKQLELMMGKPKSKNHRKKISEALKGKPKSKEAVEKMKANLGDRSGENNANYGKGTPIIINGVEYPNQITASQQLGISKSTINFRLQSENNLDYTYKK